MIKIDIVNHIKPVSVTNTVLESSVFFQKKIYFLGILIWDHKCDKIMDLTLMNASKKKKDGVGFETPPV